LFYSARQSCVVKLVPFLNVVRSAAFPGEGVPRRQQIVLHDRTDTNDRIVSVDSHILRRPILADYQSHIVNCKNNDPGQQGQASEHKRQCFIDRFLWSRYSGEALQWLGRNVTAVNVVHTTFFVLASLSVCGTYSVPRCPVRHCVVVIVFLLLKISEKIPTGSSPRIDGAYRGRVGENRQFSTNILLYLKNSACKRGT